jgi:hypothetical protein
MLLGDPSVVDLATSHRVGHDDVGFTHRQYGHALMQKPAAALMDATFGEIR